MEEEEEEEEEEFFQNRIRAGARGVGQNLKKGNRSSFSGVIGHASTTHFDFSDGSADGSGCQPPT